MVVGISVDTPEECKEFADKLELPFMLLSDERRQVINEYGASDIIEKNGKIICKSVIEIVEKDETVSYRHVSDYRLRTPVEKLLALLD